MSFKRSALQITCITTELWLHKFFLSKKIPEKFPNHVFEVHYSIAMLFLVCVNKWSVAAGISATPSRISLLLREVYTLIDMICLHELELNWTFSSKTHCCSRLVWPAKFDKTWRDNSNYLHSILSGLKKKLNESDLPFIALLIYAIWLSDHLTS